MYLTLKYGWHESCFMLYMRILNNEEYTRLKTQRDGLVRILNTGGLPEHYVNELNNKLGVIRKQIKEHYHAEHHNRTGNR